MTPQDRLTEHDEMLSILVNLSDKQDERIEQNEKMLAEMQREHREWRRENRQIRPIWIAIARKLDLFDEDEFRDVFGDEGA